MPLTDSQVAILNRFDDYAPGLRKHDAGQLQLGDIIRALEEPPFGDIFVRGNTSNLTLATQNQWEQFVDFATVGENDGILVSLAESHLEIRKAGVYRCSFSASFSGPATPDTFEIQVMRNDGGVENPNVHAERKLNAAGDIGSVGGGPGFATLAVGETIELWARCTSSAATSIMIRDATLAIEWVRS